MFSTGIRLMTLVYVFFVHTELILGCYCYGCNGCYCHIECKNESSEISNSPSTRIAHGDDANEGEAPYQVLIIARDDIGKSTEAAQQCSGSLIRLNFVLTAAHCLLRKDVDKIVEKYELFAGSSNLLSPNQYLEVWTQTCSPGCVFIPSGYKNDPDPYIKLSRGDDIGLIKLMARGFQLDSFRLTLIAMNTQFSNDFINDHPSDIKNFLSAPNWVYIFGWGNQASNQFSPNPPEKAKLKRIAMRLVSPTSTPTGRPRELIKMDGSVHVADRRFLLASTLDGQWTCQGDSGGPAVFFDNNCNPLLVGIVSKGNTPCHYQGSYPYDVNYFTSAYEYQTWISQVLQANP